MGRIREAALTVVRALQGRASLADACVACVLSGWRGRAPGAAVVVAGAGLAGCAWTAGSASLLPEGLALLLTSYTAGARGISRRQIGQLVALVACGIAACALAAAAMSPFSGSAIAVHALPLSVAPALAGLLVARQRALADRLAAATERLRITADEEPDLARAALGEVTGAGRAALADLRRILGVIGAGEAGGSSEEDGATLPPASGVGGIVALVERRRAGGLPVRITVTGTDPGFSAQVDAALYRLVQEALTNVVKHARSAATEVQVTIDPTAVRVQVRNAAPGELPGAVTLADAVALAGSGRGLTGMRERVESCGGQLRYGPLPGGGFAILAEFPLLPPGPPGELPAFPAGRAGRPRGTARAAALLRATGPWAGVAVALGAGCADACASADRTGPLALNLALVAGMSLALLWRRRAPLAFLVAVNLLALPISDGLTSINNPTLVSTYVFVVPIWAVAAWSASRAAVWGLALTVGFDAGEGLYWHLGGGSIVANVLLSSALLEVEQQAREALTLAQERTRMVARLHTLVAEEVSAMIVAAESVRDLVGTKAGAGAGLGAGPVMASIGEIERTGRESLTQLREILGVLRSEYDPAPLPS